MDASSYGGSRDAMISILRYLEMDQGNIALQLYNRMQHEGVVPDKLTFVGALNACGRVAGVEQVMRAYWTGASSTSWP